MKRGRDSEGEDDDSSFKIEIEWELVGNEYKAVTIPPNDVFSVPADILDLNPYNRLVVHVPGKYLIVHAKFLEASHPSVTLGSSVYIFFSNETLSKLRAVVPGLPDPDPRLKVPKGNHNYPNGYKLESTD